MTATLKVWRKRLRQTWWGGLKGAVCGGLAGCILTPRDKAAARLQACKHLRPSQERMKMVFNDDGIHALDYYFSWGRR